MTILIIIVMFAVVAINLVASVLYLNSTANASEDVATGSKNPINNV